MPALHGMELEVKTFAISRIVPTEICMSNTAEGRGVDVEAVGNGCFLLLVLPEKNPIRPDSKTIRTRVLSRTDKNFTRNRLIVLKFCIFSSDS